MPSRLSRGRLPAHRRKLRLFSKRQPSAVEHRGGSTAEALLVPGLVLLATIMLSSALSSGFDRLYPLRVLTMAAALWSYRSVYRATCLRRDWLSRSW